MVRDKPEAYLTSSVAGSSGRASRRGRAAEVHLSNLPENLAFFAR
jgi:hypothetical protein